MSSLFCRHNRFTAECPICSKGTVLAADAATERPMPPKRSSGATSGASRRGRAASAAASAMRYPQVATEPLEREGRIYEVRFEKVPGGLRLGEWRSGVLERRAPALPARALRELFDEARGRGLVGFDLPDPHAGAATAEPAASAVLAGDVPAFAASAGRSGDMQEELRVDRLPEAGFVRVARWIFWPGTGVGWELQDAPVMLPESRFAEVATRAAEARLL